MEIKLNKSALAKSTRGMASAANATARALKKELTSLRSVIKFLSDENSAEAEDFRNFLGLAQNATKAQRDAVAAEVSNMLPCYATRWRRDENGAYAKIGVLPLRASGAIMSNWLDALRDTIKHRRITAARRHEIATQLAKSHGFYAREAKLHEMLEGREESPLQILQRLAAEAPSYRHEELYCIIEA